MRLPDKISKRSAKSETVTKALYLARVADKRGDAAKDVLRGEMVRIWKHRQAKA